MSFTPVHFVPASQKNDTLALPVRFIRAAPHAQMSSTNHWYLYLITGSDMSVTIDCQPSYSVPSTVLSGGSKANVIISALDCEISKDAQTIFHLSIRSNTTVADIYNTLIEHGRHKYEFDSAGVGCRYWINDQLDLLQHKQILTNAQEVIAAKAGILKLWPEQTPLALDQGVYYQ